MVSMVPDKITWEAEYVSLLFSIDGMRNHMLQGITVERERLDEDFVISRSQFVDMRFHIVQGVFRVEASHLPDAHA